MKKRYYYGAMLLSLALTVLIGCGKTSDAVFMPVDTDTEAAEAEESIDVRKQDTDLDEAQDVLPEAESDESQTMDETVDETVDETPEYCYVHVCGAVEKPGVYRLRSDARVYEAIAMAGGTVEEAYPDGVNQAVLVYDGQKLQIPTITEWENGWTPEESDSAENATSGQKSSEESGSAETESTLVNINRATTAELCNLPGIGTTRAEAIVAFREEHGAFTSIEGIKQVSGIKEGLFQKIKDKISI